MGMKVLFVGLGSAGQRHLRNLKQLFGEDVEVSAFRVRKLQRTFDNNMKIREGINLDEEYKILVFDDFTAALQDRPDIVFITNRNSEHMEYALKAAEAGCHLFIEKPISNTLENIDVLNEKMGKKCACIGYQNRLHPCIKKAKEIVDSGILGQIHMVYSELGEYLPRMHPWEDYRTMHEANSALGGGVVLCQLHELDYMYYLFGMPKELYCVGGKRSSLEIDVEDSATVLCRYEIDGKEMAVNIHLDFLQIPPTRHCKIAGEYGRFEFDLLNNSYKLFLTDGRVEEKTFNKFERNDMFLEEIKIFVDSIIDGKECVLPGIIEGKKSVEFALAIKKSIESKKIIRIFDNGY